MNGSDDEDDDDDNDEQRNGSDIEDLRDDDDANSVEAVPPKLPIQTSPKSNQKKKGAAKSTDWELDSTDEKPPSFAPGSTRDEDWKERDLAAARGFGMENSYGVVTDPLHAFDSQDLDPNTKHEPPDPKTATPAKSAFGGSGKGGRIHPQTSFNIPYQLTLPTHPIITYSLIRP